jgi:hypothetical protein
VLVPEELLELLLLELLLLELLDDEEVLVPDELEELLDDEEVLEVPELLELGAEPLPELPPPHPARATASSRVPLSAMPESLRLAEPAKSATGAFWSMNLGMTCALLRAYELVAVAGKAKWRLLPIAYRWIWDGTRAQIGRPHFVRMK